MKIKKNGKKDKRKISLTINFFLPLFCVETLKFKPKKRDTTRRDHLLKAIISFPLLFCVEIYSIQ